MNLQEHMYYDDLDIKLHIGDLNVNVLYLRYEPPSPEWSVENHYHSAYELHFIVKGSGVLRVGREYYAVSEGNCYITGPDVYHEQKTDSSNPMSEFALSIEMNYHKKHGKSPQPDYTESERIASVFSKTGFWIGKDEYNNKEIFHHIFHELEMQQAGCYAKVQGLLSQIIIHTARCLLSDRASHQPLPLKLAEDKRRFLVDFYFGECYRHVTPELLEKKLGISKRQLMRIIFHYYGMTFTQKLTAVRIKNAQDMLINTDMSVEKISENVGFKSANQFYREFKKIAGVTPGEFRGNG